FLCASAQAQQSFSSMGLDEARQAARTRGLVVMAEFYAEWCGWCQKLDRVTWRNGEGCDWLNRNVVAIKIEAGRESGLAKQYGVHGYPTLVFLNPDGLTIGQIVSYRAPLDFLDEARRIVGDVEIARPRKYVRVVEVVVPRDAARPPESPPAAPLPSDPVIH